MSDELATYSIKGIDRATPARDTAPGTCLAIENMIPVGPPSEPYWSIATPSEQKGSATGILSLGRQTRQRIGPLADTDADPDQSLERLLALKAGGVYVIDPGQGYQERQLYEFAFADSTRRAHFTQLGESVFMSVTRGGGSGTPDQLLEVRDDAVHPFGWPDLPIVGASFAESDDEDAIPDGTYAIRWAYLLDDGSIGPASGPIEVTTGTSSVAGWEATFTIQEIPTPIPSFYEDRLAGLAVLVQAPVTGDQGDVTVPAVDAPAYQVARFEDIETGATLTWQNTREGIAAGDFYEGSGVRQHDVTAGTAYSYNKRLLLGDVAYDLDQPDLRRIVDWTPGESNSGGDDVWLIMRVRIKTAVGIIERFSDPLPFDSAAAETVETRSGLIWYRDSRATRWDWFVSTDYSGDVSAATWNVPVLGGNDHTFEDAAGGNYSYHRTSGEPLDISTYSEGDQSVAGSFTGELEAYAFDYDADNDSGSNADTNDSETATLPVSDVLGGGETLQEVRVDAQVALFTDPGSAGEASAEGSVLVEVLDSSDAVLDSAIREYEGSETLVLDGFPPSDAATIRIITDASANADQGGGTAAMAQATASANDVNITTSTGASETVEISAVEANSDDDRDPNRIIYSEPFQPLNYPPANAIYAGESNSDTVLAMATVGQEVSEGQFGQYPIICFGAESIRLLEVGTDPFITAVTPLTTDMGLVGRDAWTNVDGLIYAVSDRGVYRLTPQLEDTPISYPLHDIEANFLSSLGPSSVLGFYNDRDRGRRELWLSGVGQTWVWSFAHQTWTSLSRERRSFARLSRLFGIDTSGQLQDELGPNEPAGFTIVTNLFQLGQTGYAERIRELLIEQRFNAEELNWQLVTKDPNAALVLDQDSLNRATLPSGLLARDLLPNILVEEGTLVRGDLGTIRLPKALGYSWFLRLEGTAKPDQGIEGFGATFQPRRRSRAPSMFPDQPETSTFTFSSRPQPLNPGDVQGVEVAFSPPDNIDGVLWGDGTITTSPLYSHNFTTQSDYSITAVAQPDFSEITEVEYTGAVDLSTVDHSEFTSLEKIITDDYRVFGKDNMTCPFGAIPDSFLENATVFVNRTISNPGASSVDMSQFREGYTKIVLSRMSATGTMADVPSTVEYLDVNQTSVGGTADETTYPPNCSYARFRLSNVTVDLAGINEAAPDTLTVLSIRKCPLAGSIRAAFLGQRSLETFEDPFRGATSTHDLSGSVTPAEATTYGLTEGEPVLPSSLQKLDLQLTNIAAPPTNFSGLSSLQFLDLERRSSSQRYNPGDLDATISGLYASKSALSGLTAQLTELYFNNPGTGPIIKPVSSLSDESLDKICGLGAYAEDGLIDHLAQVLYGTVWQYSVSSQDAATDTISVSGDLRTMTYYTSDGGGWTEEQASRFATGSELRIIGGPDEGVYTIASVSYDAGSDQTQITLNETLSTSDASGQIVGYTSIDVYQ